MKYKKGEFGYWWTVEKGNVDIEGKVYAGSIACYHSSLTSLKGAPEKVGGNFYCSGNALASLEGAPKEVGGTFNCSGNALTTLEGAPEKVGGSFYCNDNVLTTLKGSPKEVGGTFYCSYNKLTSLKGAPKEVGGSFHCSDNALTTLKGSPKEVGGSFDCSGNALTTLKGAPKEVGGYFDCSHDKLTTLEGTPKEVGGSFYCNDNVLTTLKGAPKEVGGYFVCSGNPQLKELLDKMPTQAICGDVYKWCEKVWSFFDGVPKRVQSVHHSGSMAVYKMEDGTYAVCDGEYYSHGATLKEAKEDLIYKRTSRDLSEFKKYTLDTSLGIEECIRMYRSITGACSLGTKEFCSKRKLKKAYTVGEVIEITDGAYGNGILRAFFNGER